MDEVPFELFAKIFSYLSLEDKTRCKRVSKGWKMKIEHLHIRSLTVTDNFKPSFDLSKWFDRDQFIDYQNYVLEENFESSFLRSTNRLLSHLSELILCDIKLISVTRALYVFSAQIERLMINGLIEEEGAGEKLYIVSPKVRVLALAEIALGKIVFILPQLKLLEFDSLSSTELEFHHPSSVEHVEFDFFESCLEEFDNLKILKFHSTDEEYEFKKDFLQNKLGIEEIHFGDCDLFDELQRQREEYKLSNLKLFYHGLNVTNWMSLKQFDACHEELNEARLNLYIENYSKMADRLPFEAEIDFADLEPVYSRLPSDFWTKLMYLDSIQITKRINDESKFFDFMRTVQPFGVLKAEVNCISTELLKSISTVNPLLVDLMLNSETTVDYTEDDLKTIISYFANLSDLEFEFDVSLEFVKYAFENRKYLYTFAFHHKGSEYVIEAMDESCSEHGRTPDLGGAKVYRLIKDDSELAIGTLSELLEKIRKKKFGFLFG